MSVLDRFEKSVEGAVNGVFAKFGSKDLQPVDLSSALEREIDAEAMPVGRDVGARYSADEGAEYPAPKLGGTAKSAFAPMRAEAFYMLSHRDRTRAGRVPVEDGAGGKSNVPLHHRRSYYAGKT